MGLGLGHHGEEMEVSHHLWFCSHLHPVMVAWNTGPKKGSQEEVGGTDNPEVSTWTTLRWV